MKTSRPARVPRSAREPRTAREPRAPRAAIADRQSEIGNADAPVVGSLWYQLDEAGRELLHADGERQLFTVAAVKSANRFHYVAYKLIGAGETRRMGLAAFRNRFIPAK